MPCKLNHRVDGLHVSATDVEEVLFAGVHCGMLLVFRRTDKLFTNALLDVGGGSVPNGERFALARIPLRWMIRECFKANTGIIFDSHMLKYELGMDMGESGPTLKAPPLPPSTTQYLAVPKEPKAMGDYVQDMLKWWNGPDKRRIPCGRGRTSEGEPQEELDDAVSLIYDQLDKTRWRVIQSMSCMWISSPERPHRWK